MSDMAEWQIENLKTNDGTRHERIRHLMAPRFSVRVVQIDPFEMRPVKAEGSVDLHRRPAYRIDHRTVFCEIDWTDDLPEDQQAHWIKATRRALVDLHGCFDRWKSLAPVQDMAERIDLDISTCCSWSDYTEVFCRENDRSSGDLVKRMKQLADVVSTGEVPVLLGMLHAADYSRVADEIGGNDVWRRLSGTCGEHAEAAALAIMRQ
jgi:hypothetical protein